MVRTEVETEAHTGEATLPQAGQLGAGQLRAWRQETVLWDCPPEG